MIDATLTGIDSRYAQEKQVASRHECIRKTIRRFFLIHISYNVLKVKDI